MTASDRTGCSLPLAVNAAAWSTNDPLKVEYFNLHGDGLPYVWCGYFPQESPQADYGMGITNVVQTGYQKGVTYFLKTHRPGGDTTVIGAGVAIVSRPHAQFILANSQLTVDRLIPREPGPLARVLLTIGGMPTQSPSTAITEPLMAVMAKSTASVDGTTTKTFTSLV